MVLWVESELYFYPFMTPEEILCVCSAANLYLTLCDPMNGGPPGSSVHGISQARKMEWLAIFFSRGSFQARG